MKVSGTGSSNRVGTGTGVKRSAGGAGFSLGGGEAAEGTARSGAAAPGIAVSALSAMLSVQEDDTSRGRRRQAVARGNTLLDQLERIRNGLLTGSLPVSTLQRLQEMLADAREGSDDPALTEVLAEIELRAAVELAKLEAHSASRP